MLVSVVVLGILGIWVGFLSASGIPRVLLVVGFKVCVCFGFWDVPSCLWFVLDCWNLNGCVWVFMIRLGLLLGLDFCLLCYVVGG